MIDREFAVTLAEPVSARVERGGMVIWKMPYGAQLVLSEVTDDALLMHPDWMTMAAFLEPVSSLERFLPTERKAKDLTGLCVGRERLP